MAWTCTAHGRGQDAKASHTMTNGLMHQKKSRKAEIELDWHNNYRDLKSIGMAWEDAEQAAVDREDWRGRVAQCVFDRAELRSKEGLSTDFMGF